MSSWIRTTVGLLVVAASGVLGCVGDATDVNEPTSAATATAGHNAAPGATAAGATAAGAGTANRQIGAQAESLTTQATGASGGELSGDPVETVVPVVHEGPPPPHPWTQPDLVDSPNTVTPVTATAIAPSH